MKCCGLRDYCDSFHASFTLSNEIEIAEQVISEMMDILREIEYFPEKEILNLQAGLIELMLNSIEHGNLEISGKEKSLLLSSHDNSYYELLETRKQTSPYMDRRIFFQFSMTKEQIKCNLKDEGPGFNFQELEKINAGESSTMISGRGIYMTRKLYVDELVYNQKGDEVSLIKKKSFLKP